MEIVKNKALRLKLKNPHKITSVIPNSAVEQVGQNGMPSTVLVHWTVDTAQVMRNVGIKNVPSPIVVKYPWPGLYQPFTHQIQTAAFLTLHRRAFCLNDPGTAKSATVAWTADYLMNTKHIKRVLIICPLSIMKSAWVSDLFKVVMHRKVGVAHGDKEKRAKVIASDAEFVIINFDGAVVMEKELQAAKFDLIVVDEANMIKTVSTSRWKTVNRLVTPSTWLWMLTGTPASQSPLDAYGLAKLVNPANTPRTFTLFRDMVMTKMTTFKWVPKPNAQEIVHRLLQPAIRFTKEQCLDLPEMLYTTREVPLSSQQKKYYDLIRKQMAITAAGEEITAVNAAVKLGKMLQIASGSVYADNGETITFDVTDRLNVLVEAIEESTHKTLVFAPFRHAIELIREHLASKGISAECIHGGVSVNQRTEIFNKFQTEKEPRVLVIQPQAASHGVTLHAANTIVWWAPVTSYETYAQANARVHRAGQVNKCLVVKLQGSPVEAKLYAALDSKEGAQLNLMNMYKEMLTS